MASQMTSSISTFTIYSICHFPQKSSGARKVYKRPLRHLRCHLSQRERLWHAGSLPTGRLRLDMAQEGGPCLRGQARLYPTSPSRLRRATSPCRRGFGSPRKVNGFARGSPTRGAVERSETERLYKGKPALCSKARPSAPHRERSCSLA